LRPADVDARLPIPGTGEYEWRGYESFADQPHAVDPPGGFLANWNNKPAFGWTTKPQLSFTNPGGLPSIYYWGPNHQVEPIQADLAAAGSSMTFDGMGRVEAHVATVDNRARVWMPSLLAAIDAANDPSLQQARDALASWNGLRVDTNNDGTYDAAGLALFDRWVEHAMKDTFTDDLGARIFAVASGIGADGHFRSADNGDVPTFKTENALISLLTDALAGHTARDYFAPSTRDDVVVQALREAIAELGADPSKWVEADESGPFAAQGAGSSADVKPLLNRGSYGQIVEAGAAQ
jgi:acyl-homoserine lactone acylase PvdQ